MTQIVHSDNEVWVDSPTHSFLQVSSHGRYMYKPHKVEMPNGGFRTYGGVPCWGRKSVTKSQTRLEVYNRTTKFRKKVHILICEAFHGLKPFEGAVVMHLDDNPLNNHKDNLKWATQKENLNTESFIAYCKSRTGDNHPFRRGKL